MVWLGELLHLLSDPDKVARRRELCATGVVADVG